MKRNLFAILLILATLTSSAQHLVKGKVIDQNSRPIVSANIVLQQKSDKSTLQTSITDSTGLFLLNVKPALQRELIITAMGFESTFIDLPDVLNQDTALLIRLTDEGKQLQQVSIYSKIPLIERKTDRILFNVENSLSAIGGDGVDALSKAPGVRVNDEGSILLEKIMLKSW